MNRNKQTFFSKLHISSALYFFFFCFDKSREHSWYTAELDAQGCEKMVKVRALVVHWPVSCTCNTGPAIFKCSRFFAVFDAIRSLRSSFFVQFSNWVSYLFAEYAKTFTIWKYCRCQKPCYIMNTFTCISRDPSLSLPWTSDTWRSLS